MKPKVIAVIGPTASGKTSLGIFLAQKIKGEIISADSRQVYRGLDIGTGKVTKKEMTGVPHHLLDVANPKKQFTVSDFVTQANKACSNIFKNSGTPIIVGGTGLYVDALFGRMLFPDVPPNEKLRAQLEKKSVEELFLMLQKKDPVRANTIEPKNKRRLVRALEIAAALGRTPTGGPALQGKGSYDVLWLGLNPGEKKLQKNIHDRLVARLKLGMIAEAKRLHERGLSYKRMRELGLEYRYLADYLQGKLTKKEFEVELERAINHYAKRQIRWFKRNQDIHWVASRAEALRLAKAFLGR